MSSDQPSPRFFHSHSSLDKALVTRVHRSLQALGLNSWLDKFEIRPGESLVQKIMNEGVQGSDYVCAFITEHSAGSAWVREELEAAFNLFLETETPKIIPLRFDQAPIPFFLKHRLYCSLERHEHSAIMNCILKGAHLDSLLMENNPEPYSTLDFHDAYRDGPVLYLLASRVSPLDDKSYKDRQGIPFSLRDIFVLRWDADQHAMKADYLTQARLGHSAMRVIGSDLLIFFNRKVRDDAFEMSGDIYRLKAETLRATSVSPVFEHENWGWSPWIDEYGSVHHGDSDTPGNPYRIGTQAVPGKKWDDLSPIVMEWRRKTHGFEALTKQPREVGYLTFLDVDPTQFT